MAQRKLAHHVEVVARQAGRDGQDTTSQGLAQHHDVRRSAPHGLIVHAPQLAPDRDRGLTQRLKLPDAMRRRPRLHPLRDA